MNWLSAALDVIGIGGKALERRSKRKEQAAEHTFKLKEAELNSRISVIEAQTQRAISNDEADNRIDYETVKQNAKSWKDELLVFITIVPFASAVFTPFVKAYKTSDWTNLVVDSAESFKTLALLPEFYMWMLVGVYVYVLGFRRIFLYLFSNLKNIGLTGLTSKLFKKK